MSDIDYEKVDWEDEPSTQTSVSRRNLGKMDQAIYDIAKYLNKKTDKEYILSADNWIVSGDIIYPYYYSISSTEYSDDDHPLAQVWGINTIETEQELDNIKLIAKVIVSSSSITVYASGSIDTDLKLILKM